MSRIPEASLCACGCGSTTPVARRTNSVKGHVRGQHVKFCHGHRLGAPFAESYAVNPDTECWEWTAGLHSTGYGKIKRHGKTLLAHRVSYELVNGVIPEGLEIDHLCLNRCCVNPAHLEAVSHAENMARREWCPSRGIFPVPRRVAV